MEKKTATSAKSNGTVDGGIIYHRVKFAKKSTLQAALQTAIKVELSTIPAYYTALLSMQETDSDAYRLTRSVLMEEMFHVYQACGLLIGIGGRPKLTDDNVPTYPNYLPGFEHHSMPYLALRRASTEVFSDVFMKIEKPGIGGPPPEGQGFETIGQFYAAVAQGMSDYESAHFEKIVKEWIEFSIGRYDNIDINLLEVISVAPEDTQKIRLSIKEKVDIPISQNERNASHNAIVEFIEQEELKLFKQGKSLEIVEFKEATERAYSANEEAEYIDIEIEIDISKPPLFQQAENMAQWQDFYFGKFGGKFIKVTDLESAQAAVNEIVQQGEGSLSPTETRSITPYEKYGAYNHYGQRADGTFGPILGTTLELSHYYSFQKIAQGMVPFPKTYPITSDPNIEQYSNPIAKQLATAFNIFYSSLLRSLEKSFQAGEKNHDLFFKVAITIMHSVIPVLGAQIMQLPTRSDGDPAVGPNAAPTFEYIPLTAEQQGQTERYGFSKGVDIIQSVAKGLPATSTGQSIKSALEGIMPNALSIQELCVQEDI